MMEGRRKEIGAFTDDDSRCQTQPLHCESFASRA